MRHRAVLEFLLAAAVGAVLASSCVTARPELREHHDDEKDVTCWSVEGAGVTCLPDRMIETPPAPHFEPDLGTVEI